MNVAVTADIVGSRRLEDRTGAQRAIDDAIAAAERDLPLASRQLRPTVGDEQQGVYPDLTAALLGTLLMRLALPDGVDLRFGIGVGELGEVPAVDGPIPDGPGWWAARAAIEKVHAFEQRAAPEARTWVVAADGIDGTGLPAVNAYLLARDRIVADMTERTRRLTYGRCLGRTQRQLAADEGITQSAVSQALSRGGATALIEGFAVLRQS